MVRNARAVSQSHESLSSFRKVAASSNRKFGVTVGGILVVLALWPLVRHHHPRVALLVIGGVLLACGIVVPAVLAPVNKLWFRLGMLLASITNPIAMAVMFYGAVVPFGWYLRWRGRDLLRLAREPASSTYWITREPGSAGALTRQF